ncbi:BZ3500_MvSof-1268-A1-R1_Chr6-2g08467 [Microbotryum saponariae]|uniref:BZ3500_MvSof-1268-A1-R1_Chr6-2g08467 protein n=1 Tax=Microbotryum saponariae TaxID=289078 RepID=A0A2X0L322_9BASI|nr:BZ3500_MvSof-1268-A1-R1_Chr6-2g08467 [Microbotryum saponariae]SDA07744.1 BZ3501_MvSof-1269-A2-R1_Chr6-1g08181 [Microbotryum saponariae]
MSQREGAGRVKNRAPAAIQITAEQLLREAADFQEKTAVKPKQHVEDLEELHEYRGRKRQEFEETIRRTRSNITAWAKYANWEAAQGEFPRSRSVFERALDVDPTNLKLWLSYTEMELKARNIAHARNLFDRAVTLLPRIDRIWYKYVYLEEMLGNVAGARQVFERWMAWEPDEKAWSAYIKLEIRYNELDRASVLYERLVNCHPEPKMFIKWAKFEEERRRLDRAREIFTMGFEFYGQDEQGIDKSQSLYSAFAKMEVRHKEYDRARVIYKFALERLPRTRATQLYAAYTNFEKQFGDRQAIETTVLGKRRIQYEEELTHESRNYDVWFDYARLEEDAYRSATAGGQADEAALTRVREVYERAVAQVPPSDEKRHWRRYIFTWLNYALFEELETKDLSRARDIYKACLKLVPHKRFTFAKVWVQYAEFEVRQMQLDAARKIFGTAIGMAPKDKLFKEYIELELKLREFDRLRTLYQKWLEFDPSNATAWIKFTELEAGLQEFDRARAIYELAVDQPSMDMPELIWKSWIDFEYEEEEYDRARELYERLLQRTSHVKVWVSFAQFEVNAGLAIARAYAGEDEEDAEEGAEEKEKTEVDHEAVEQAKQEGLERARAVFERGYNDLKKKQLKEERVVLLEAWKALETNEGDAASLAKVVAKMPRVVKKMRKVDGDASMMEEYYDLIFPDDETATNAVSLKVLEMAAAWKEKQAEMAANKPAEEEEEDDDDDEDEEDEEEEGDSGEAED